jgi:hypothetical protein
MTKYKYILILFLIGFVSCKRINRPIRKDIVIDDYSIEITFSSFWDCGDFKKYVLNNLRDQDPRIRKIYKKFNLYTIDIKDNCKPPIQSDTLVTTLTKSQSDSLFDLSNKFIDNFRLINHIKQFQNIDMGVNDGANVKIELCLMNKCKSATYYHYGHLKEISSDMKNLIEYIDLIKMKK